MDFYPANGNIQPYCQFKNFYKEVKRIKSLPIDEIIRSVFGMQSTCDHRMAKVYFIHSFLHPELYLGKSLFNSLGTIVPSGDIRCLNGC